MSKVSSSSDFGNVVDFESLKRWVSVWAGDITGQVNGGLDFNNNIFCKIITYSFTQVNAEVILNHNLGKIPIGYILVKSGAVNTLCSGSTAWTTTTISLKSTTATDCSILIF